MSAAGHMAMKKKMTLPLLIKLLSMNAKALKGLFAAYMATNLAQGLFRGLAITSMQVMFDAVGNTLKDPTVGLRLIIPAVLYMVSITIGERFLNRVNRHIEDRYNVIAKQDLLDRMNRKAGKIDPMAYEDTDYLEAIEKANKGVESGILLARDFLQLFTYYLPYLVYMCLYLYSLRAILPFSLLIILVPVLLSQFMRSRFMGKLENTSAPIRREYDHYEQTLSAREYMKETRQLGAFGFLYNKYKRALVNLNIATWKFEGTSMKIELVMQVITVIGYAAVLVLLAFSLKDGFITVGAFAAVYASIELIFDEMYGAVTYGFVRGLSTHLPLARNLMLFFDLPERGGSDVQGIGKRIKLENASFRYPGRNQPAIENVNLVIRENETIALVGENGAGKSTLVKLITGVYLPSSGTVKIGDVDTSSMSMQSLFKGVSGITQNYQKYMFTARDNVVISDMAIDPDENRIDAAAKNANVSFENASFPEGLDTMLSREFDGVDLSGGQWQRLAIARGLYRDHGMIVMDEPTAAIDPIEETELYKRFMSIAKGRTSVLVTHRLGSAKIANRIVVMDKGRIVEEGSHDQLMAKNGLYSQMYEAQSKWYEKGTVTMESAGVPKRKDGTE